MKKLLLTILSLLSINAFSTGTFGDRTCIKIVKDVKIEIKFSQLLEAASITLTMTRNGIQVPYRNGASDTLVKMNNSVTAWGAVDEYYTAMSDYIDLTISRNENSKKISSDLNHPLLGLIEEIPCN